MTDSAGSTAGSPACTGQLELSTLARALGLEWVRCCSDAASAVALEDFLRARPGGVVVRSLMLLEACPPVVHTLAQALAEADRLQRRGGGGWFLTDARPGARHAVVILADNGTLLSSLDVTLPPCLLEEYAPFFVTAAGIVNEELAARVTAWARSTAWNGPLCLEIVDQADGPPALVTASTRVPDWLTDLAPGWGSPAVPSSTTPLVISERSDAEPEHFLPPLTAAPGQTPRLVLHPDLLARRLAPIRAQFGAHRATFAYSVKTNPEPRMIEAALDLGMDMEVITHAEWRSVVRLGADPHRIIINGPGKWWPRPDSLTCRALFVNSLPEFEMVDGFLRDRLPFDVGLLGVRLRLAAMNSRFGVPVDDAHAVAATAEHLLRLTRDLGVGWGVHFHHAQSSIGTRLWIERCSAALQASERLAERVGVPPVLVDFGGGWHARDLDDYPAAIEEVAHRGPEFVRSPRTDWVFELGKSLVEPLGVLYSRVLVPDDGRGQVVVDACWGDLFESPVSAHRVFHLRDGCWERLAPGDGALFGRTCMEHDILARHVDVRGLQGGDLVVFADAGAYDVSLSFEFAEGRTRTRTTV